MEKGTNDRTDYIKRKLKEVQIGITDRQLEQFEQYFELLITANKVMNLTAVTEFEEVVSRHFLDSVLLAKYQDLSSVQNLIDVGTGAGFPGIPLKILFPQLSVTLLDSLGKRIAFLRNVVDNLGLEESKGTVRLIHGRAEDLGRDPDHREKYDLCLSRAVANLSVLSEYCTPFVKTGGLFVSYKSGEIEEELEAAKPAIKKLGCKTRRVEKFSLDGAGRSLIFIERVGRLSEKYPRKAGIPSRQPL